MRLEIYNRNGRVTQAELEKPGALDGPIFFGPGALPPAPPPGVDADVERAVRDVGEIKGAKLPAGDTRLAKAARGLVKIGAREIKRHFEDGGAFRFGSSCRATIDIPLATVPFFFGLTALGQELGAADQRSRYNESWGLKDDPPFVSAEIWGTKGHEPAPSTAEVERRRAQLAALTDPLRKLLEEKGYSAEFKVGPSYDERTRELSVRLELPPRARP